MSRLSRVWNVEGTDRGQRPRSVCRQSFGRGLAVLLLIVAPVLVGSEFPASAQAATVRAERPTFATNERISLIWSGFPGATQTDWITITPVGTPDDKYGEWTYLEGHQSGTISFNPVPVGNYEVRGYFNWTTGGYNIQARSTFSVTAAVGPTTPTTPPTSPPTLPPAPPPTAPVTAVVATLASATTAPPTTPGPSAPSDDADTACLHGDIDNLGFGFSPGFDVFSGRSTPPH